MGNPDQAFVESYKNYQPWFVFLLVLH